MGNTKPGKKILSIILAFAIALALLPFMATTVFAEESVEIGFTDAPFSGFAEKLSYEPFFQPIGGEPSYEPFSMPEDDAPVDLFNCVFAWDTDPVWTTRIIAADGMVGEAIPAGDTVTVVAGRPEYVINAGQPDRSLYSATEIAGIRVTTAGGVQIPVTARHEDTRTVSYNGGTTRENLTLTLQRGYDFEMPEDDVKIEVISDLMLNVYHQAPGDNPADPLNMIRGERSLVKSYSLDDLLALYYEMHNDIVFYSCYDNMPAPQFGRADQYVSLMNLLSDAGLAFGPGDRIGFIAVDGYNSPTGYTMQYDEILGSDRYYYQYLDPYNANYEEIRPFRVKIEPMIIIQGYQQRIL